MVPIQPLKATLATEWPLQHYIKTWNLGNHKPLDNV